MIFFNKHIQELRVVGISIILVFLFFNANAQNDSVVKTEPIIKEHSPKRATLLSAILPGAGQVYNKKWWKVPLVYGAIGTCLYIAIKNNTEYNKYFGEQVYRVNNPGLTLNPDYTLFTDANLTEQANYHRKWRDNFFVFTGIAYLLNLVDANVDAHLFNFDVSDDLSLHVKPYSDFSFLNDLKPINGITLSLTLR